MQRQALDIQTHVGRKHPKISDWSKIVELYEQGYSSVELAEKFHVTPQAIWYVLRLYRTNRSRAEAQKLRSLKTKTRKKKESGGEGVG